MLRKFSKQLIYLGISFLTVGLVLRLECIANNCSHVDAISNIPTNLSQGKIIPPDYFASIEDFSVPKTIGQDFSKNATYTVTGGINAKFVRDSFIIPSSRNANAVAVFNQPLDPDKDFSISAEITVPDARIAAAGIFISDIPPSDIATKLGVNTGYSQGSSGALAYIPSAYTNHYMFFSGFHNVGGFAAILASGDAYTRNRYKGVGNSNYMDRDYVAFGSQRSNVKIWATISYNASTGNAQVSYKHNSLTNNGGTGSYNRYLKEAVVDFRINKKSPVYLGIVGNGGRQDYTGSFTSQTTVTSVTGTYLKSTRNIRFVDDINNDILPASKIIVPHGGLLGIGNKDETATYYYDKPNPPSGYTYDIKKNSTTGDNGDIYVRYQRDFQTVLVKRINNVTGKKIFRSEDISINGVTKENLNVNVPKLEGYYYVDKMIGDTKNVKYSLDGSGVDFNIGLDDTSNGINKKDCNEQIVQTFMNPSVQERILDIEKPDGTKVIEKQMSTTDTDFLPISGKYYLPGYRVVMDGIPVNDSEIELGIPGEATDTTDNLKSAIDKVPQLKKITYKPEPQKATITFHDLTKNIILKDEILQGVTNQIISCDVTSKIKNYLSQGYILKSSDFIDGHDKFDNDTKKEQHYTVELVRDSKQVNESKYITHEVNYLIKRGVVNPPADYKVGTMVTHTYFIDQVSNTMIIDNFQNYAVDKDIDEIPKDSKYTSGNPDVVITKDGKITFSKSVVPQILGYIPTVSENNYTTYQEAKNDDLLRSKVIYKIDDTINVNFPVETIFYNTLNNPNIKAPNYSIINASAVPVKISIATFAPITNNVKLPTDFNLNLKVKGQKVSVMNTKLVENGVLKTPVHELAVMANFMKQYNVNNPIDLQGISTTNIINFTYSGSATTPNLLKIENKLTLKFENAGF